MLQPVAATIAIFSGPYTKPVAASIMRMTVASPQPMQEPAPPTYSSERSASIMSASTFSLMYREGVSGSLRKKAISRLYASTDSGVLRTIDSASWTPQTSTHSAQPLHFVGSTKRPNRPPSSPFFSMARVVLRRLREPLAPSAPARPASPTCASSFARSDLPITFARMAVSGHLVTHSMQPTHFSRSNAGKSGAM